MNSKRLVCLLLLTGCLISCRKVSSLPAPEPRLSLTPPAVTLTCGQSMRFGYQAEGRVPMPLVWKVSGGEDASIGQDGTFRAPGHPGSFTVRADAAEGSELHGQAQIRVVSRPEGGITAPQGIRAHSEGLKAEVPAQADTTYQWSIQGGQAKGRLDQSRFEFSAGAGPVLVLKCHVTNAAGDSLDSSLELPVSAKATLKIHPGHCVVSTGESFRFGYDITGKLELPLRWEVVQPAGGTIDREGGYVAPDHAGRFRIRVFQPLNDGLGILEDEATVEVVERPSGRIEVEGLVRPAATLEAHVPRREGMTYRWAIAGGTLVEGQQTPCLRFTVGQGPFVTLVCRISNAAEASLELTKRIEVPKAEP